ncbi:MAG: MauE/DoxX family redox-associated membrane protein [Chloroflexota bacterium]|nr:MauE/DoxX family redox-associated membrane protein [Chloroflexota bacterium]
MPLVARVGRLLSHPYLTLAARLGLGGVFIFAGTAKLGQIHEFVTLVSAYEVLPTWWMVRAYAYVMPPLEVALGIFLVFGVLLRISSAVSILVLVSFIIAKGVILSRGWEMNCGCFGTVAVMLSSETLALAFVLLALAVQILFHRGEFLALGPWLKRRRQVGISETETTS